MEVIDFYFSYSVHLAKMKCL